MGSWTQVLFNKFFSRVNSAIPDKTILKIITDVSSNPTGQKLFKQTTYTIAKKIYDESFKSREAFQQYYLPTNPILSESVYRWLGSFEAKVRRDAQFQEREAKREGRDHEGDEEKRLMSMADWEAKKQADNIAKWVAIGDSYREKVRNGQHDFNVQEVEYARLFLGIDVVSKYPPA
jgi:hypothetical protein